VRTHPKLLTEPQLPVLLLLPTFSYANTSYLIVYAVLSSWNGQLQPLKSCCSPVGSPLPGVPAAASHTRKLLTEPQLPVLLLLPTFPYANTSYLMVYAVWGSWNDSCSHLMSCCSPWAAHCQGCLLQRVRHTASWLTEPQLPVLLLLPTFSYANTSYLIVYAVLSSWNDSCSHLRAVAALLAAHCQGCLLQRTPASCLQSPSCLFCCSCPHFPMLIHHT